MENYLSLVHSIFDNMQQELRNEICRVLGWSEATYYRRKTAERQLSPDEKCAVTDVAEKALLKLLEGIEKAQKSIALPTQTAEYAVPSTPK